MRGIIKSVVARVTVACSRAPISATAGVSTWRMRNGISKAIVAGATVLSLAASAVATAEPAVAQWRNHDGGWGWQGSAGVGAPLGPPAASASAPHWSGFNDDPCWQVRPIYSISGAWLDNRRVNVCY